MAAELEVLNFALAGAREGFGPFLGVFLQERGFAPATTGLAMSLAGLAGVFATTPLGALIDRLTSKRAAVAVAVTAIAAGAGLIVATNQLVLIAAGQILIGLADTSLAPLVSALTLGLVGQARYTAQVARNEIFNHGGNAANAALAALLGLWLGLAWVALAIAVMAVATMIVVRRIGPGAIDHDAARSGDPGGRATWRILLDRRPLLLLAAATLAFETASGAMLAFLAQALSEAGRNPALVTGAMAVTVQLVTMASAALVPRLAPRLGHPGVMAAALALVALRAALAATSEALPVVAVVELLEGVSTGLAAVAIPALVVEIMSGTGHANAGLGGVMTAFGAGAALSPALAGLVAQMAGFRACFATLGGIAALGFTLWVLGSRALGRARQPGAEAA